MLSLPFISVVAIHPHGMHRLEGKRVCAFLWIAARLSKTSPVDSAGLCQRDSPAHLDAAAKQKDFPHRGNSPESAEDEQKQRTANGEWQRSSYSRLCKLSDTHACNFHESFPLLRAPSSKRAASRGSSSSSMVFPDSFAALITSLALPASSSLVH
eukprot:scaffold3031_cov285-Pinguiococcus_pyrenoidosus.AAC.10